MTSIFSNFCVFVLHPKSPVSCVEIEANVSRKFARRFCLYACKSRELNFGCYDAKIDLQKDFDRYDLFRLCSLALKIIPRDKKCDQV